MEYVLRLLTTSCMLILRLVRSCVIGIACIVGTIIAIIILIPLGYTLLGYRVNANPSDVAAIGLQRKDPTVCNSIVVFSIMGLGPSGPATRGDCWQEYITNVPDAEECRRFATSARHSHSCFFYVAERLNTHLTCGYDDNFINCYRDKHFPYLGIADCKKYANIEARDWCYEERTATLPDVHDCDKISSEPIGLREECERLYALKLKDRELCSVITDAKRRELCEVEIDVWQQYGKAWGKE